jgi:hypothetical protein
MRTEKSFGARQSYFANAWAVAKANSSYNPSNPLIMRLELDAFVQNILTLNNNVGVSLEAVNRLRIIRNNIAFKRTSNNPNTLEERIYAVVSYLKGERSERDSAYRAIHALSRKLRPKYKTKPEGAERGSGKSPSEKSFGSLSSIGGQMIEILKSIADEYTPGNQNITIANLTLNVDQLRQLNEQIAATLKDYGDAIRRRDEAFDGTEGLSVRIVSMRNYLASFEGGKKNSEYIEFNQALKGV